MPSSCSNGSPPLFILIFSQSHTDFRRAEFESVCRLSDICPAPAFTPDNVFRLRFPCPTFHNIQSHIQRLRFPDGARDVGRVLSRAVLVKGAYELLLEGNSHEELLEELRKRPQTVERFNCPAQSWCVQVRPQGRKRDAHYAQATIKRYASTMRLEHAPICLGAPNNLFALIELYSSSEQEQPDCVCLTRFVGEGQGGLKVGFSLHKRCYIGNSTMDPELAFIQANLALAHSDGGGTLALDPFCGTGGLLLPAAHFGAHVFGMEIKWDVARAKGKSSRAGEKFLRAEQSIRANFAQYGMDDERFLGILLADSSRAGVWHSAVADGTLDAIITDPPYGIRERGQRLGQQQEQRRNGCGSGAAAEAELRRRLGSEEAISQTGTGFPGKQKYAMSSVFLDLMDLAARLLRVGGRLVFWFPVCRSEYTESCLPRSPCLRLVHNCEQQLTKDSSRRLLAYEKHRNPEFCGGGALAERAYFEVDCYETETFRQKLFNIGAEGRTTAT